MKDSTPRADLTKEPAEVAAMFDSVAPRYDLANDILSAGQVFIWRAATVNALDAGPGQEILDLAAGTGTSAAQIAKTGANVVACDLSAGMVEVGRRRHPEIQFVLGNAEDLPFPSNHFDAVTISFGIRNVQNVRRALEEMRRVVKPGGCLVICEFSTPQKQPLRGLYRFYLEKVMPQLGRIAGSADPAYDYLMESISHWPDQQAFGEMIADAGWQDVAYRSLSGGIVALHRAHKPGTVDQTESR